MNGIGGPLAVAVVSAASVSWIGYAGQPPASQPVPPRAAPDRAVLRARLDAGLKRLEPLVGEWDAKGTMGPVKPDGTHDEQAGTWSNRWILDGKHLEMNFDVQVNGRRVEYRCVASYNPLRERYETVWIGSSGYRFAETGTFDASGAVLTLTSFQDRPGQSEPTKVDSVFRFHENGTISVTDTSTDPSTETADTTFEVRLTRRP